MCIHGQKAISRKSEPNLSEGRSARWRAQKILLIHSHVLPPSFLLLRRNSSATRRWI